MNASEKTRSRDFESDLVLDPDASVGDRLRAMRLSRKMTITGLARASGISDRDIRFIENHERQPTLDGIRRLCAAMGVEVNLLLNDELLQRELRRDELLSTAQEKYGSRGMAQAMLVYDSARAVYAGGKLNEAEQDTFRDLMMDMFFDSKEKSKKFTPRKYRKETSDE
ncbi:MAG: helix-turn-helix transcriptional regulator [Clostridia bacterium]|nr:helix-turn-helix transcriptional regulator [Clostridia bacterium]